jgi:putative alpha-1,2-mannosidase
MTSKPSQAGSGFNSPDTHRDPTPIGFRKDKAEIELSKTF